MKLESEAEINETSAQFYESFVFSLKQETNVPPGEICTDNEWEIKQRITLCMALFV